MTTPTGTEDVAAGGSIAPTVASPTTGEPVKLFSREWISGILLR